MALNTTPNWLGYEQLPRLTEDDTLLDAFRRMAEANVGAVMVYANQKPHKYLPGEWLKSAYFRLREMQSEEVNSAEEPLRTVLKRALDLPPITAGLSTSLNSTEVELQDGGDTVFLVRGDNGQSLGWFLNHDTVVQSFHKPPPVFLCENNHENPDPDHGFCYRCPGKIRE